MKNKADFDSKYFCKLMIRAGFVRDKYSMSLIFNLGEHSIHVMEYNVLWVYSGKTSDYTRIELDSHNTVTNVVTFLKETLIIKKILDA